MAGSDKDEREALIAAIAEPEESVARASDEISHREAHLVELRSRLDQLAAANSRDDTADDRSEARAARSSAAERRPSRELQGNGRLDTQSRFPNGASRRSSRELDGLEVGDAMHSSPARRLPLNT